MSSKSVTDANEFEASIIMAVYNVEPFIREAVDSLLVQMIGFDRIQLIMVDDGSTDGSGAICDEYAALYPSNIIVVHKENGGVASARNEGLKLATGRYINFMDPDDKLSPNTVLRVSEFFLKHDGYTDVVAIPLIFFDGACGEHPLNTKFSKGNRVIDLYREPTAIQLSMASTFIKRAVLEGAAFDERLTFAEDAKLLLSVLANKATLGVVCSARYYYRKRTVGTLSAIQKCQSVEQWYLPCIEYFHEETASHFLTKQGYIPKFVQHTLAYDLQWRIKQQEIPDVVPLSEEDRALYKQKLVDMIRLIDDDVILYQKSLWHEHKLWALLQKYEEHFTVVDRYRERFLRFGNTNMYYYSNCQFTIEFIKLDATACVIEGYTVLYPFGTEIIEICAEVNGEMLPCRACFRQDPFRAVGEDILQYHGFVLTLPLQLNTSYRIKFFISVNGNLIEKKNVVYKKYAPVGRELNGSYYANAGWVLRVAGNGLSIVPATGKLIRHCEFRLIKELWTKNGIGTRKAIPVRLLARLLRRFKRGSIWLICDKADRADDNGEAFFTFLQSARPRNVHPYFLISEDSPDWQRLSKIGKTIPYMSWKHKLLYLIADFTISAYSHDEINNPFFGHHAPYRDLLQSTQYVFLQHGIVKDDLSRNLNRAHKNIKGFVTSTERERLSIVNTPAYLYQDESIWLTGLPRYDRLYHDEQNSIVIMPTWRRDLFGSYHFEDSHWDLKPGFHESEYYRFYYNLLTNERLLNACAQYGYTINFVPHPTFFSHLDQWDIPTPVKVWGNEVCYRDMFAQNKLLVTDYSSVAFDFAYLRKPVIYAHFDSNNYAEGYFSYEEDGFGEITQSVEETVNCIISYLATNCDLKDIYRKRIDGFFAFADKNNCQRVLDKILALQQS